VKTNPCPICGSTSSRGTHLDGVTCRDAQGCNARKCARRKKENRALFFKTLPRPAQCMAFRPSTRPRKDGPRRRVVSMRFCELSENHEGMHLSQNSEWPKEKT
jgi:hypothetical protein